MMRSSVATRSSLRSGEGSTVRGTLPASHGAVDRQLTDLSTKIEIGAAGFYERYRCPDWLRTHSVLVGRIALLLAVAHAEAGAKIDAETVALAAYLHDLGRSPLVEGESREHNELSALILAAEGMQDLVEAARRHPVYAVLDPATSPRDLPEKIVHVADRRGGLEILSLEERFAEVAARHPRYAAEIERSKPAVRLLEREILDPLGIAPDDLAARLREVWP